VAKNFLKAFKMLNKKVDDNLLHLLPNA